MSLFTKENQAPAPQWRYTNATDADARAVQAMYWARQWGYSNTKYLEKAKKMGDFLRYGMYDVIHAVTEKVPHFFSFF